MKKIVKEFLLTEDAWNAFKTPKFTYVACRPFPRKKKRIKKF